MARKLNDWITGYLNYVKNTEPPIQFHVWSAVSIIAAALQRRVYVDWEDRIFPNQYVILVGASGATRKGVALGKARYFLDRAKMLHVERGNRVTKEQLIIDIKENATTYNVNGIPYIQSATTQVAPELSVFLGQRDLLLLSWLTDWYDCLPRWENRTKTAGIDDVQNMCYNLLAATAPDWLSSMLPEEAFGGGFTSRCMFVYEPRKRQVVADPRMTPEEEDLRELLLEDYKSLTHLAGRMHLDSEMVDEYIHWYEQQEAAILEGMPPVRDARFNGYIARRQTHCWKLCMAMAASRGNELWITKSDFHRAKALLETTERKMVHAFGGIGPSKYSNPLHVVIQYLQERGAASHSEILRQHKYVLDDYTLKIVTNNLRHMGIVTIDLNSMDPNDKTYRYIEDSKEEA